MAKETVAQGDIADEAWDKVNSASEKLQALILQTTGDGAESFNSMVQGIQMAYMEACLDFSSQIREALYVLDSIRESAKREGGAA